MTQTPRAGAQPQTTAAQRGSQQAQSHNDRDPCRLGEAVSSPFRLPAPVVHLKLALPDWVVDCVAVVPDDEAVPIVVPVPTVVLPSSVGDGFFVIL